MIYRKRGSSVRWEHGTLLHVVESGFAVERDGLFECAPEPPDAPRLDRFDESVVVETARALAHLPVERLVIAEGAAEHEYGERRWSESTRRLHVALVNGPLRALVDQGDFDTALIETIARSLSRAQSNERPAPPLLRLAPNVTAALLPGLVGIAPPNVRLLQTAGGIDGKGREIVEAENDWPNWYRPSYRVRPVRMPLNIRLECDVKEIDRTRPVAIALLAPVQGLTLHLLVDDGERPFPATVRISRIDAVAGERAWYPYGAGSFGAELML